MESLQTKITKTIKMTVKEKLLKGSKVDRTLTLLEDRIEKEINFAKKELKKPCLPVHEFESQNEHVSFCQYVAIDLELSSRI